MSNRLFLLNEASPSTQPCQDRTACGSIKPIVSSQFHQPVRHINHKSFKNSQKQLKSAQKVMIDDQLIFSDHIAGPADLLNQHQEDQALSFGTCFTTPCSSSYSVQAGLLQCSLDRSSRQFYRTFTINSESGSKIHF